MTYSAKEFFDGSRNYSLPLTKVAVVDTETLGLDARWNPDLPIYCTCILEVALDGKQKVKRYYNVTRAIERLQELLADGWLLVMHNAKHDLSVLNIRGLNHTIVPGELSIFCTQVAEYTIDSTRESYSLQSLTGAKDDVIQKFVEVGILEKLLPNTEFWSIDWSTNTEAVKLIADYCVGDVKATLMLYKAQAKEYNEEPRFINTLAYLEFPMLSVLSELEVSGSAVDMSSLASITQDLYADKEQLEKQIALEAGMLPTLKWNEKKSRYIPFVKTYTNGAIERFKEGSSEEWKGYRNKNNLLKHYIDNDGIALTMWEGHIPSDTDGCFIYDHCPLVKFNSSAATGHVWWLLNRYCPDVLEAAESTKVGKPKLDKNFIADISEQIPESLPIAKITQVNKTLSMVEGISKHIQHNHRIHPSFQNTRTRTTRLSCTNPNLQQMTRVGTIINGTDYGKRIRSLFSSPSGSKILVADLDRIEIAVLAFFLDAMCNDSNLKNTVNDPSVDVHQANADLWGVSRTVAKTIIFLLVYGGQPPLMFKRGLTKTLEEAKQTFDTVNRNQPAIQQAKLKVYKRIEKVGYISNPFRARGRYPELMGSKWERLRGERQSFNYLIQKTARDVMHLLTIHSLPIIKSFNAKVVNLVHDELVVECPESEAEQLKIALNSLWNNRLDLLAGTRVNGDWNIGNNWAEAK